MNDLLAKKLMIGGLTLGDVCRLIECRIGSIEVQMRPSGPVDRKRICSFRHWELTEALDLYYEYTTFDNDPEIEMRFPLDIEVKVKGNKVEFMDDGEKIQILFLESKEIDLAASIMGDRG